jgi:hypothetical protein
LLTSGQIGSNDQILFERGGEYFGSLDFGSRTSNLTNLTLSDYGPSSQSHPVITGASKVSSSWSLYKGSIYFTTLSGVKDAHSVFVDSQRLQPARWPNQKGIMSEIGSFARMSSCNMSKLQFSANFGGRPAGYWVGSRFHFRSSAYTYSYGNVSSHSVGKIVLKNLSGPTYECGKNYGYFFTSTRLEELDTPGEWFFNPTTSKLYVWLWDSGNPSSRTVKVASKNSGIHLPNGFSGVTISNLKFHKFRLFGIEIQSNRGAKKLAVKNCEFYDIGNICLCCLGDSSVCSNNTFNRCGNSAIYAVGYSITIADNVIANSSMIRSDMYGQGFGIKTHVSGASNVLIERNWVMRSGYGGISFPGGKSTIRNNYVIDSCLILSDCGAIYQPIVASFEISKNIVNRAWGNIDSLPSGMNTTKLSAFKGNCIYLDNYSGVGSVLSNILVDCDRGVFIHGGVRIGGVEVFSNLLFGVE